MINLPVYIKKLPCNKSQSDMALYRSASFSQNFRHLEKLVCHLNNYAMKTILSDAESSEEHD